MGAPIMFKSCFAKLRVSLGLGLFDVSPSRDASGSSVSRCGLTLNKAKPKRKKKARKKEAKGMGHGE